MASSRLRRRRRRRLTFDAHRSGAACTNVTRRRVRNSVTGPVGATSADFHEAGCAPALGETLAPTRALRYRTVRRRAGDFAGVTARTRLARAYMIRMPAVLRPSPHRRVTRTSSPCASPPRQRPHRGHRDTRPVCPVRLTRGRPHRGHLAQADQIGPRGGFTGATSPDPSNHRVHRACW